MTDINLSLPGKKGILIFDLDEPYKDHEFECAQKAMNLVTVLTDIYNELRNHRKYKDTESLTLEQVYELINTVVKDNGVEDLLD
jgi:hypothetical protein